MHGRGSSGKETRREKERLIDEPQIPGEPGGDPDPSGPTHDGPTLSVSHHGSGERFFYMLWERSAHAQESPDAAPPLKDPPVKPGEGSRGAQGQSNV
jgi:hypothetical protein